MRFHTEKGMLEVGDQMLTLTELDGNVVECTRHIDVVSQREAEVVADAMHHLAGRFSEGVVNG